MNWKDEARQFFSHRAKVVGERPALHDLCYVSGRDPRVWADQSRYDDMMDSIVRTIGANASSRVLEVGCAAGFIACGVAPKIGQYVGVDVAEGAIECASSLNLPNATFRVGDGGALPFDSGAFDSVYCYDVLTNFPTFDSVKGLVQDMVRVVRPGGKVLLGSIPDASNVDAFLDAVARFQAELAQQAPATEPAVTPVSSAAKPAAPTLWTKVCAIFGGGPKTVASSEPAPAPASVPSDQGGITCFYFAKQDFESFAKELGVDCVIEEVHLRHPFYGYRYNVVLTKPA
ncbi:MULTISPECIES: class I SAM-dependent methyltransferase [Achromobacter]|uniref:class I SAM-dependent methyltransferase n=1 Tax=Achromobacter TaxID=222 RepID=UPI0001F4323C|nr:MULTISPECIES: class I SAM-dependent methyltransferase [Achromobacter]AXA80004.1 demethylmenaquinone methyltransferase [Achromobacter xylosoxidans]EFV82086.1 hypothetical protein HMPREF0005_00925 [Achromobacter xylosoxidans C54]MCZ8441328.1 class I SAM-dependent methyltransferase [Achromobacter xylosoxidans]MDC6162739.1 class I SAM-dependent methyltransferase [Achromobacter xylosoxidans]OFU62229.1 hypothetical protein HMPREF3137_29060 [Achromobacter xylosoxidans]